MKTLQPKSSVRVMPSAAFCPICGDEMRYFGEALMCSYICDKCDLTVSIVSHAGPAILRRILPLNMNNTTNAQEGLAAADLFAPLRDQLRIQGEDGNWNYDAYMQGLYNGMECALATLERREPQYRAKPEEGWIRDRIQKDFVHQVCEAVPDDGASAERSQSLDEKLEALRYCIVGGHDEDAQGHLFGLLSALRLRGALRGMSKTDLTPSGHLSLALLSPNAGRGRSDEAGKQSTSK